ACLFGNLYHLVSVPRVLRLHRLIVTFHHITQLSEVFHPWGDQILRRCLCLPASLVYHELMLIQEGGKLLTILGYSLIEVWEDIVCCYAEWILLHRRNCIAHNVTHGVPIDLGGPYEVLGNSLKVHLRNLYKW